MDDIAESKIFLDGLKTGTRTIAKFIGWLGSAAGGVTLLLTACGYIVNYAYLESLGVPRSSLEIKTSEHILAGGNYLMSLVQFSVIGMLNLLINAWWFVLVLLVAGFFCWRLHLKTSGRLIMFTMIYLMWLLTALSGLAGTGTMNLFGSQVSNAALVMMHTATTAMAVVYLVTEVLLLGRLDKTSSFNVRITGIFLGLVVLSSVTMLPYLKGAYATSLPHPTIVPLVFDQKQLGKPAAGGTLDMTSDLWRRELELIQVGENNIVLRDKHDHRVIIISSKAIPAYQLLPAK